MKLISFDIGIKNMAYCMFEVTADNKTTITDWNILNLMDSQEPATKCSCMNEKKQPAKKSRKGAAEPPLLPCSKLAKYRKIDKFYCEKHATKCSQYIIPKKENSSPYLKKQKNEELVRIGNIYSAFQDIDSETVISMKKRELLNHLSAFFEKKCFEKIAQKISITAGKTNIITIARNMTKLLNSVSEINDITHVIIENQIVDRMKTIQGILSEYFIIKTPQAEIEFVSSQHKLKQFENGPTMKGAA